MAGIPESIGVPGEKMFATKFATGLCCPLYLAVIIVEANAGKVCSLMATI
jgi:hypothetical protein